jgi:S1-C subfamily serine protease
MGIQLFRPVRLALCAVTLALLGATLLPAQQPVTATAEKVNKKLVKLFGAGGFKSLPSYGTGIMVSHDGYILTVNNHILLTTADLRVHLHDGRLYHAKVVVKEPELDVALLKIDAELKNLPYYNLEDAAKQPLAEPGDWVLAFGNQFQIATRGEPMSVQRGVVAAYAELRARRGVFDPPFRGEVYFIDAICNNPGAAGGAITNRKGDLLGIIGRELKSTLSDTWINYAVPVQAKASLIFDEKEGPKDIDLAYFVGQSIKGLYKAPIAIVKEKEADGYHGIVLVPDAVPVTPPYVEEIMPGSPAAKAGLRPDDLIVYINGELVPSIKMFRGIVKYVRPGDTLQLEVQRGNKLASLRLTMAEQPKKK